MTSRGAPKDLEEAVERLRVRNEQLKAYLDGEDLSASKRIADAPSTGLEDATARAKKYWDKLEGRRSSVPPAAPATAKV